MKTKLLILLLTLAALLPLAAEAQNQLTGTINNGAVTITGFTGIYLNVTNVIIPATVNGYPVTSIGDTAFNLCSSLTNVVIGTNVTNIGESAFAACISLTSVVIPDSVTNIGELAFDDCNHLTNVMIGNSVTSIGIEAFANCALTSVTIPNSVTSIGNYTFADCALTSVTIPNSVTSIGNYTFEGCALTNVAIGSSVTNIGAGAFYGCTSLASVTIPNNVTNIGDEAFFNCWGLMNLFFLGNAPALGGGSVFYEVPGTVYYYSGTTGWGATYGGLPTVEFTPAQFTYATNNGAITITGYTGSDSVITIPISINGHLVTSIGSDAFSDDTNLTSIVILNNVTNIGNSVFSGCSSLAGITVNTGNPNYSSVNGVLFNQNQTILIAFPGGLDNPNNSNRRPANYSYTIPGTVTNISDSAFFGSYLSGVIIPNSVASIGPETFGYCTNLTNFLFQGNAPALGSSVFYNAAAGAIVYYYQGTTGWSSTYGGLPTVELNASVQFPCTTNDGAITITGYTGSSGAVTIPASINGYPVTSIGDVAFDNSSLTSVTIPNSVTSIGDQAFENCSSLTNVTIGNGVTTIGGYAFGYCAHLTSVAIPNSVTSLGGAAFYACPKLTSVTIGNGVTIINEETFDGCTNLTNVTIPGGVMIIDEAAFAGCASLTGITIPNSVTSLGELAFDGCASLTSVTVPSSVTSLGDYAFAYCSSLTNLTFQGNAPSLLGFYVLYDVASAAKMYVYYYYGTSGWSSTYGERPTVELGAPPTPLPSGTINFDDLPETTTIGIPITNGYWGLTWNNFSELDGVAFDDGDSGYFAGVISPKNVAFNVNGSPAYISNSVPNSVPFNFISAYLTAAWNDNMQVQVEGFAGSALTYSNTYTLSATNSTLINFNYFGVTKVYFNAFGGTKHTAYGGSGEFFAMDNVVIVGEAPKIMGGGSVGVQSNGGFGFNLAGVSGQTIAIEASTNLVDWQVIQTITLSGTSTNFTDAQWKDYPNRYYRAR